MQMGTCSLKVDRESKRACKPKDASISVPVPTNDDSDDSLSETRDIEDTIKDDDVFIQPVTTR